MEFNSGLKELIEHEKKGDGTSRLVEEA